MRNGEFEDARLVPVYDADFRWSREDDFFLNLVNERPGSRVLDLGCGTGRLTVGIAAAGHTVMGIDPAEASIAAAVRKPGAEAVRWMVGTSSSAPKGSFDVALMTSHVAQFMVDDDAWASCLVDLRGALVAGGRLIFDSRDPDARGWEAWNPAQSRHRVRLEDGVEVWVWNDVTAVTGNIVDFTLHYEFPDGQELLSSSALRFRDARELGESLRAHGFDVDTIYGGWKGETVGAGDGELIVDARAR